MKGIEFHASIRLDAAELEKWHPDRLKALFEGMAQVLAAQNADGDPLDVDPEAPE